MNSTDHFDQLIKTNRRWRFATVGILVANFVAIVAGQAPGSKEKVTDEIVILSKDGKSRLRIGQASTGEPGIFISDAAGTVRCAMWFGGETPMLQLADKNGNVAIALSLDSAGAPNLLMRNATNKQALTLGIKEKGGIGLLMEKNKSPLLSIKADEHDRGLLMFDGKSNPCLDMGVMADGFSSIELHNAAGAARAVIQSNPDGRVGLQFCNKAGTPRVTAGVDGNGASLVRLSNDESTDSVSVLSHPRWATGLIVTSHAEKDPAMPIERAALIVSDKGESEMRLDDKKGDTLGSFKVADDGSISLTLSDEKGTRLRTGVTGKGPLFEMMDGDGKSTLRLPTSK